MKMIAKTLAGGLVYIIILLALDADAGAAWWVYPFGYAVGMIAHNNND
jgi:hypothetical protein